MFLDLSNLVSSGEILTYISLLLIIITKNKDINNITILLNIKYEASILLLTISGKMLYMQKYCCYDTKYKNTCIVCILKLWFWIQEISLFQFSLTVFWVMKFLAMGSACKRYNDTTFSRIIWTAAVTHSDQISWNVYLFFSCMEMMYTSWMSNKKSNYHRYSQRNPKSCCLHADHFLV